MAETKKYLTMKERICFTVGAFGRSGIYTLMSMFTLVFFQNGAGLTLKQGTTIILIGRVFDALNDPVMGMIVDRTKSKWGKMRPYLLFAPIPIAITTIALFSAPFKEGSTAAFVWALVTYILWGVAFTVQDVPFWGLSSVITPLESERTSFISTARLGSTFGGILPALLVPILYQSNMGYTKGFFLSGVIFALLGCGLSILIFFVSKERVPKMDHTPSFKETFVVLGKNRLLIIVIFAAILGSTMVTANQCADYIGNYIIIQNYTNFTQIFQDFLPGAQSTLVPNVDAAAAYDFWIPRGTIVTTLTVAIGVGMVPAMAIFPMLRKKFSLKQIYIGSALFGLVVHALCYVVMAQDVTKANIYVLWVFLFLMGLPLGIYNVITYALIADSVDYLEWKTGERQEGVCFAFQTFLSKVNAAVATFVFGQILDGTDFKAVDKSLVDNAGRQIFFQQSVDTQKMLLALVTIVPAVGFLLTIIPMFFNNYTGKVKEQAQKELEEKLPEYEKELKILLLPKDENDDKNVIVEIRGGAGGDEAALFAGDLFRMYNRYAERRKWKVEIIEKQEIGIGGIKEAVFSINGLGAYSRLKFESGVHRVQRVPETESAGRVHTSTATVAVLPEVEDVKEVKIDPKDLKIDTYRSGGAGGQHVNMTDSAVRITHLPTGIVATSQDGRSQHDNRDKAMKALVARVYDYFQSQQTEAIDSERKSKVGTGDRAEKIRTYNYPQNRVTDHRIGLTIQQLDRIIEGKLDDIITALINEDQRLKLEGQK